MAHHKSYRKRAAEAFRSGVESPLEALGSRALREAQAELQRKAAELDDRDPAALEMLEEALAHEPRDAHERRAAARAFLGVTKSATRVNTKGTVGGRGNRLELGEWLSQAAQDAAEFASSDAEFDAGEFGGGEDAMEEAQAYDDASRLILEDGDLQGALEVLESTSTNSKTMKEARERVMSMLDEENDKSAVEAKSNERDPWALWIDVQLPIAANMVRVAIKERIDSSERGYGSFTEDDGQELLDLLESIEQASSTETFPVNDYEGIVEDMRELADRSATMDFGNTFTFDAWHKYADELERHGDGLSAWYNMGKSAGAVRTKDATDSVGENLADAWLDLDEAGLAELANELDRIQDEFNRSGADDPDAISQAIDSLDAFRAKLVDHGHEYLGSGEDQEREARDSAASYIDDALAALSAASGVVDQRSASDVETKGAMPIVAFDAANEEGLDDLEADVNELAYKHNASGMDADTSGGHCEVYFEAAIDAANFVEALQAGDLIGYTVSNVELVPTDGEGDGEEASAGAVETKKRGGDPYRDFTKVLVKLSKGYRDLTSLMTAEAFDDAKANDPDLYAVMGEIEDVTNFMGDIHSVDGWAVDDVMAMVNELKGKLDSFDVEDPSLQAAIDAVVYNWDEVIPELETAIEAIDKYEDSY